MNASAVDILAGAGSQQKEALSWKATALLGVILFGGSLGLSLLAQEIISGTSPFRSAVVRSADPDYRIELLERAASRYPGNPGGWLQLGNAYSEAGRSAMAASAYENYLTLNPNNPDIWTNLGIQYTQTGMPDRAIDAFDKALSLNPRHEASQLNKGFVRLNAFNDLRGAIRSWMQVLEANPEATAPDGIPLEEWISYCQTASSTKIAGAAENLE